MNFSCNKNVESYLAKSINLLFHVRVLECYQIVFLLMRHLHLHDDEAVVQSQLVIIE